ncbi:hypothetical protein BH10BAC5_BH10BAC5_21280 [soil metagenome]
MLKLKEIIKSPEYWLAGIQNEVSRMLIEHSKVNKISQTKMAEELGVSKSYLSQIMNGTFNFTIKKLIELCLYAGKIPSIKFISVEKYLQDKNERILNQKYANSSMNPVNLTININSSKRVESNTTGSVTSLINGMNPYIFFN